MSRNSLNSLGVTQTHLTKALAKETRAWARKRLKALLAISQGNTQGEAAKVVGVTRGSVERWIAALRTGGLATLLQDRLPARGTSAISAARIAEAQAEIAKALKRRPHWRLQKRLEAVSMVLSGGTPEEAAAQAHVLPKAVKTWLSVIRRKGIVAFLERSELHSYAPRLDVDAAALRELAAQERNPRVKKRILAVAHVVEGMGYYDAGVAAELLHGTVKTWVERVKKDGIAVLGVSMV